MRDQEIPLAPTEFKLLQQLALNVNCVMLHENLLTEGWGPQYRDDIDYLGAYVSHLRRKIEEDPSQPRYSLTTLGVGYMLSCPEGN